MVLRPIYHPQEDEQNMQYPYRATEPLHQGTWQTPYGAEHQTTASDGNSVPPQGPPIQYDHTQLAPSYAAPSGENLIVYENTQHRPAYNTNQQKQDQPDYEQQRYNHTPPYEPTQYGPHGYEDPSVTPFQTQGSYNTGAYYTVPGVEQEEQLQAPMQQSSSYLDNACFAPPGIRYEQGYQAIPAQASPPSSYQDFEQDRGVMGAIAGAAAGGYAGHKMHHGFLGALGSAYAGHKLEDAYKDHKKHSPSQSPVPPASMQSASSTSQPIRPGNFSASSHDITLDKDYDLIASCKDVKGRKKLSAIALNDVLTNDDGHFKWFTPGSGSGNFAASGRHIKLRDNGKILEAELRQRNGQWRKDVINLDERIENVDGDLKMT